MEEKKKKEGKEVEGFCFNSCWEICFNDFFFFVVSESVKLFCLSSLPNLACDLAQTTRKIEIEKISIIGDFINPITPNNLFFFLFFFYCEGRKHFLVFVFLLNQQHFWFKQYTLFFYILPKMITLSHTPSDSLTPTTQTLPFLLPPTCPTSSLTPLLLSLELNHP